MNNDDLLFDPTIMTRKDYVFQLRVFRLLQGACSVKDLTTKVARKIEKMGKIKQRPI